VKFCQNAKNNTKGIFGHNIPFLKNYQLFLKIEKFSQNLDFDFSLVEFFLNIFFVISSSMLPHNANLSF
jgi:hypothetical protein